MKIGISLLGLIPGQMGGIEFYARQLLKELQQIDVHNEYVIFSDASGNDLNISAANFKVVPLEVKYGRKLKTKLLRISGSKNNIYSQIFNRQGCDIIHFPFQVIDVPGVRSKKIISIMDLQHEHFPQYFRQE